MKGTGPGGPVGWHSVDRDEAQRSLGDLALCPFGLTRLRLVDELPTVLHLTPHGAAKPFAVVSIADVERAFPAHAELLARWRQRRDSDRRTVVG